MVRRWLLWLLCIALPVQAMASTWPAAVPCPMAAEMAAMLASGELAPQDLPPCCNDPETAALTGQPCKAGQQCGAAVLALPVGRASARLEAPAAGPFVARMTARVPDIVALPWRPPAAL